MKLNFESQQWVNLKYKLLQRHKPFHMCGYQYESCHMTAFDSDSDSSLVDEDVGRSWLPADWMPFKRSLEIHSITGVPK